MVILYVSEDAYSDREAFYFETRELAVSFCKAYNINYHEYDIGEIIPFSETDRYYIIPKGKKIYSGSWHKEYGFRCVREYSNKNITKQPWIAYFAGNNYKVHDRYKPKEGESKTFLDFTVEANSVKHAKELVLEYIKSINYNG